MNEFLKLNWRIQDLTTLEPQSEFINADVVANSWIYKHVGKKLQKKTSKAGSKAITIEDNTPGGKYFLKNTGQSVLTKRQQNDCLVALQLLQSGKDRTKYTQIESAALQTYQELQSVILEENIRYNEYAKKHWALHAFKIMNLAGISFLLGKQIWEHNCLRYLDYKQFYKSIGSFSYSFDENQCSVEFNFIKNLLEVGTVARFARPSFISACFLEKREFTFEKSKINSKLPVSFDKNINELLKTNEIDLVISSGGLNRLADYSDGKTPWLLPVTIKEVEDSSGNKRKVVFVDKPLPSLNPHKFLLAKYALKRLLKSNCCQYEALKFEGLDLPVETENQLENSSNNILHNASYRLWNIKRDDQQNNLMKTKQSHREINILVRSKLDGCEVSEQGPLAPILLKTKLEHQLFLGANLCTKSELSREWTSLFFTPFSTLYRARIMPKHCEVVTLDKVPIQRVISDANVHYEFKPHLALGILEKVFGELINLELGDYLLQHTCKDEAFLTILRSSKDNSSDCLDLHLMHQKCEISTNTTVPFLPLDPNYILPVFQKHKRPPCIFTPKEAKKFVNSNKKKGKKKKRKPASTSLKSTNELQK